MSRRSFFLIFVLVSLFIGAGAFFFFRQHSSQVFPATAFSQKFTKETNRARDMHREEKPDIFLSGSDSDQGGTSDVWEIMAWVYPGEPACVAKDEYADGRTIDILKPEYFAVNENGNLVLLTEDEYGCNGYSPENVADIKKHSEKQFVTISSSYAKSLDSFLKKSLRNGTNVNRLTDFVVTNGMTGIELDFEDFGGWSDGTYNRYKNFVRKLGTTLHGKGKKLMIDGPAIPNDEEANWYPWRYEDFVSLPVDYVVVMAYDYQFDHGAGSPIAPFLWVEEVLTRTVSKFPDVSRLSVGVPSYGYEGVSGSSQMTLLTYDQTKDVLGFDTATRDVSSGEMKWTNDDKVYFYQDSESLRQKRAIIEKFGIFSVSIWHIGGNQWFEEE